MVISTILILPIHEHSVSFCWLVFRFLYQHLRVLRVQVLLLLGQIWSQVLFLMWVWLKVYQFCLSFKEPALSFIRLFLSLYLLLLWSLSVFNVVLLLVAVLGLLLLHGLFSNCREWSLLSSCAGFSLQWLLCCRAWALGARASVVAAHGLGSWDPQALGICQTQ